MLSKPPPLHSPNDWKCLIGKLHTMMWQILSIVHRGHFSDPRQVFNRSVYMFL